jgi:hypothetical protein
LVTPGGTLWTSPYNAPVDALNRKLAEITYWQFVREYLGDSAAVLAELDDTSTYVTCYCTRPSSDAFNYEMWDRNSGATEWNRRDTDSFPFTGTLFTGVDPEVQSVLALNEGSIDPNLVRVGMYAALENELVAVLSMDLEDRTVTVARGVLDTVPVAHSVGAKIHFHQGMFGLDRNERAVSETVEVRILPSTSLGRLPLTSATTNTITCVGRMMRPYPPGNVKVNTLRWPTSIGASAPFVIDWVHRDRTIQTVTLNKQDEANIGPEAGVTYTLRLYGETNVLKKTETGLTGTTYTWSSEVADSGLGRLNTSVRFELESVRGSVVSLQKWNITTPRI